MGGGNFGVTYLAREARPEGKRVIDKRGKTFGCLPLARSAAAQAAFPPAKRGHTWRAEVVAPYDTCVQQHRILGRAMRAPAAAQRPDAANQKHNHFSA